MEQCFEWSKADPWAEQGLAEELLAQLSLAPRFVSCTFRTYLMRIRYRRIRSECIEIIMEKTLAGDWFLLYLLGQNVDPVIFKDIMHELAKKLGYRSKDTMDA